MAAESDERFIRIYRGLRAELARAVREPGAQLRVDETARAYGVSPTPVREALWKLAGERLVGESRGRGFFVPLPSSEDIEELYVGAELHLLSAIRAWEEGRPVPAAGEERDFYPLLAAILTGSGQRLLVDAGLLWIERLSLARAVEPAILESGDEWECLAQALSDRATEKLARAVRAYCRRRRVRSQDLARAIRARAGKAHEYIPDML